MTRRWRITLALLVALHAGPAAALSEVICTGDCNYDHTAAINELVTGVAIALDRASISTCRGFDPDGDDRASIDELIGGVRNALDGCPRARLVRTECEFALPPQQPPEGVSCGFVIVEEDRARNDGRTVRIPFGVFHATGPNPVDDPFVYLSGGAGGPALDRVATLIPNRFAPFQGERDLVFFDQRGAGRSLPSLECPEWYDAFSGYLSVPQRVDADTAALLSAVQTCHDRLLAEGVNFAAYTSSASARDLEDLMLALGYETWNLYGASYGVRLALTAMRDTPDHIRSVGLDSGGPVQAYPRADYSANLERSLNTLFAGCASDAACNAAFPDLEQTFFDLIAELNAQPITLHPTNPSTGQPLDVIVTGDRLLLGFQQALYNRTLFPFMPLTIASTARGDYALITASTAQIAMPQRIAWGMHHSINCNEEVPFETPEIVAAATADVREEIKTVGLTYTTQFYADVCAFWGSPSPPALENEPVVSDLPTLVLAGEYDPVAPPAQGRLVAETLSHSSFFEFPGFGHGVLSPGCATDIVMAFLANPSQAPDGSCVAEIPPPAFVVP